MRPTYKAMGLSSNIVYMRPIDKSELPKDISIGLEDGQSIFAVFSEEGEQIALIADRRLAIDLAKEHSFDLHSVH